MNNNTSVSTRSTSIIRWVARIIGTLSVAVFLFFFVADCVEKGRILIESDRLLMIVFMFLTFVGLIVAWKWEGIGGTMALIGLIAFNILSPASVTRAALYFMTGLYGLPALLFVLCWWQTRKQHNPKAT